MKSNVYHLYTCVSIAVPKENEEVIKNESVLNALANRGTDATYAYDTGVKQVVDISTITVGNGRRGNYIGFVYYYPEKAIYNIPNHGSFVALRPCWYESNVLRDNHPVANGGTYTTVPINLRKGYVSPNDIGAVAAVVLRQDVAEHQDVVYNLAGDVSIPLQIAESLSRVIGKEVPYHQISATNFYSTLVNTALIPHLLAMDLTDHAGIETCLSTTLSIEVLLGRKPETVEQYLA
ncbi:hypothetical protein MAM1_0059c03748 [Mucor ambiguus]|uniref:Uncharacterized protein n=1 Tax=Mucor ambiguus TaxID=91626 RepID=A0A0C9MQM5_9FUNG|nr:hypothetical protein MAM1_0059c03748 [Mucor ambiguus]